MEPKNLLAFCFMYKYKLNNQKSMYPSLFCHKSQPKAKMLAMSDQIRYWFIKSCQCTAVCL